MINYLEFRYKYFYLQKMSTFLILNLTFFLKYNDICVLLYKKLPL